MLNRPFIVTAMAALLALGFGIASAAQSPTESHNAVHERGYIPWTGGYLPWTGGGFYPLASYPTTTPSTDNNASSKQPQIVDLGPAMAGAAYANVEYDHAVQDMNLTIIRARADFGNSPEFINAQRELNQAYQAYQYAVTPVLSQVRSQSAYISLIEQRTEVEIAMKSTPLNSPLRYRLADEKMQYGAQATEMEAAALAKDATVQQARTRLVAAQQALNQMQTQFAASLYSRPDVVAARKAMEAAHANRAAANNYLAGQETARNDQWNQFIQAHTGNQVLNIPWAPYYGSFTLGPYGWW